MSDDITGLTGLLGFRRLKKKSSKTAELSIKVHAQSEQLFQEKGNYMIKKTVEKSFVLNIFETQIQGSNETDDLRTELTAQNFF